MTGLPTVLVTGAGGPAGVAVIRSLVPRTTVVAVDASDDAAGLSLAHKGVVLPLASDNGFVDALTGVARATDAKVLISTVAEEMGVLHTRRRHLAQAGLQVWLPRPSAVRTCVDKWAFAQLMSRTPGVPTPPTALDDVPDAPGPYVVKPRYGRGSRGVVFAADEEAAAAALCQVPEPIVQQQVFGREFTVDVLTDRGGCLVAAVPRWRIATRGGVSTCGRTFRSRQLHAAVRRIITTLGFAGVANVQGFVDSRGYLTFTEVNPRFSGGLPLSLAAGADLVGEYVALALDGSYDRTRLQWRSDVWMTRYFDEVFVG